MSSAGAVIISAAAPSPALGPQCKMGKHGHVRCNITANGCMCSRGCESSWKCKASALCDSLPGGSHGTFGSSGGSLPKFSDPAAADAFLRSTSSSSSSTPLPPRVTLALFLTFNASLVRDKYKKTPYKAYNRELKRIKWFLNSAARVSTRLPIHVVVGPTCVCRRSSTRTRSLPLALRRAMSLLRSRPRRC